MRSFLFFLLLSFSYISASEEVLLKDLNSLKTTDETYQYVYLVRHGESIFNLPDENGMYYTQGQSVSAPLTENGQRQALEIAMILQEKLPPKTQVTVASSTAIRASDTGFCILEILSKQCLAQFGGTYPDLLEMGKGKWEGLPKDEVFNKEFDKWKKLSAFDQWKTPQAPTAESLKDTAIRAANALEELIQKYPNQTLFIVSHGGTLMGIEHFLEKIEFSKDQSSNFPKFKYHNCDMLLLKIPKGKKIKEAIVDLEIKSGFPNTYN